MNKLRELPKEGSLGMPAAIFLASFLVLSLAAARLPGSFSE
jgi:hypothetical protein